MTDISHSDDENRDEEVRQNSFDDQIVSILDSVNSFSIDFYDLHDGLSKELQQVLVVELDKWISTGKAMRHYDRKYIRSRQNQDLSLLNSFEFKVADAFNHYSLDKDFHPSNWESQFPATDDWLAIKKNELLSFSEELKSLHNSVVDQEIEDSSVYQFPEDLIDKEFDVSLINSFRLPVNSSLENLRSNLKNSLNEIETDLGEKNFTAFLYNSFQFRGNPTNPVPINLKIPTTINSRVFHTKIYRLYEECRITYGVNKLEFTKIMILNFLKYRIAYRESEFNFDEHLLKSEKRIRNYSAR